jgi:hypothetical protein
MLRKHVDVDKIYNNIIIRLHIQCTCIACKYKCVYVHALRFMCIFSKQRKERERENKIADSRYYNNNNIVRQVSYKQS